MQFIPAELSNKNDSRGSGDMFYRKNFENLHTVMAISMLFKQFSCKFCIFWRLILSASPNIMHFVCTVSIMRVWGDPGILL